MTPTEQEFLDVLAETFSPSVEIAAETLFRELEEWSSMQALIVIATIDEHFGVTIPEKEFRKAQTFNHLYELTVALKNE